MNQDGPIDLDTVRRFRKGAKIRTDVMAKAAIMALHNLNASIRHTPIRREHQQILESLWADFTHAK